MAPLPLALSLVAVALSVLAVFGHQWVTLVPRLGIGVLYHLRRIRIAIAALAIGLAGIAFALSQTPLQGGLLVVVLVLTPLSGFLHAGRLFVPLDAPRHVSAADADLDRDASVVGIEVDGGAHAWTIDTLIPRHTVNDEVGGRPVLAAWCAYCNSGIVFDPTVRGDRLAFEPLAVYRRNMIVRDRETGTLWQHATGEALAGPLAGTELDVIGGQLATWGAWSDDHPDTTVALESDPSGWSGLLPRPLTRRPADRTERVELPGVVSTDRRLPFTVDVVGVEINGEAKAYPVARLRDERRVVDGAGGISIRASDGRVTTLRDEWRVVDVIGGHQVTVTFDPEADRARVTVDGEPLGFRRTRWMGWFEFHPNTAVYDQPRD